MSYRCLFLTVLLIVAVVSCRGFEEVEVWKQATNETRSRTDCECTPAPYVCISQRVTNYYAESFTCTDQCCYPQISVQGTDASRFSIWVMDSFNYRLFTSGGSYEGWTTPGPWVCFTRIGRTSTTPICPSFTSSSVFYIVVICKNTLAACQLSLSLGVLQQLPAPAPPIYSCPVPQQETSLLVMAFIGWVGLIALVVAALVYTLKFLKQRRLLCWAAPCCNPSSQEPFQSLPLDDLSTDQNQDSERI